MLLVKKKQSDIHLFKQKSENNKWNADNTVSIKFIIEIILKYCRCSTIHIHIKLNIFGSLFKL